MAVVEPVVRSRTIFSTEPLHRFTIDEYHSMINAGILDEDDKVELLEGYLVETTPKNPPHRIATYSTREELRNIVPNGWFVDSQEAITLSVSEPEPDVFIVRGKQRDYAERHPGPEDIAIVIEVSDATLQRDRVTKKRVYAEAGIPVYWIINLIDDQIELYSAPYGSTTEPDYEIRQTYRREETIPVEIDGNIIGHLAIELLLP
ncbi:MAG: Uma2 family endonuclease [Chloroflexota bacterium]